MSDAPAIPVFSKHRIEALSDGIFAVAMTLLVIELKIPESAHITTQAELIDALLHLIPKFIGWVISFMVLAIFWVGHHRLYHYLRQIDGKLTWLAILYLGLISLMPFSSALTGEFGGALISQVFYSGNMLALSMMAYLQTRHVYTHPGLCVHPLPTAVYKGVRLRMIGLAFVAIAAILITWVFPRGAVGNVAFMLMIVFGRISRRMEAREYEIQATRQQAVIQSV